MDRRGVGGVILCQATEPPRERPFEGGGVYICWNMRAPRGVSSSNYLPSEVLNYLSGDPDEGEIAIGNCINRVEF